MHFIVIGKDKGEGELRREERPAHLEYIAERQHLVAYAGPLIEGGRMIGSLFVFDLPDRAALDAYWPPTPISPARSSRRWRFTTAGAWCPKPHPVFCAPKRNAPGRPE